MIVITEKSAAHLERLRELYLEVRRATFSWLDTEKWTLHDFDKDTNGELVLVALVKNEVAGFISLWLPDNFIHHLYVCKNHRDKKIGISLVKEATKKLKYPITLKCQVKNTYALGFYARLGFTEKAKGASDEGDYLLLELKMLKEMLS